MRYNVFYEFNGRKMRTEVEAGSVEQAKHIIEKRIIFHKVVKSTTDVDFLKDFFGFK